MKNMLKVVIGVLSMVSMCGCQSLQEWATENDSINIARRQAKKSFADIRGDVKEYEKNTTGYAPSRPIKVIIVGVEE